MTDPYSVELAAAQEQETQAAVLYNGLCEVVRQVTAARATAGTFWQGTGARLRRAQGEWQAVEALRREQTEAQEGEQ